MKADCAVETLQAFEWKGQQYTAGQIAQVTLLDAIVLAKQHLITLTRRKIKVVESLPPSVPVSNAPTRRRYRRRDLQAEETAEFQPVAPSTDEQD
jgi:hypothetical protein